MFVFPHVLKHVKQSVNRNEKFFSLVGNGCRRSCSGKATICHLRSTVWAW
jgi:hypothetical protein